jgi:hypothetical protein
MTVSINPSVQVVYWRRDLPPLTAEVVGEHTLEADSRRVALAFSRGDEEWGRCYGDLMTCARARLAQEVVRLGGHYAHVRHEIVSPRHDEAAGEAWLYGCFEYVLYREPENVA